MAQFVVLKLVGRHLVVFELMVSQSALCTTGRQCGGGAGVQRSTVCASSSSLASEPAGDWTGASSVRGGSDHGERRSGALSGAMSSVCSTETAVVSMAVASDVITLDWKKRSGKYVTKEVGRDKNIAIIIKKLEETQKK